VLCPHICGVCAFVESKPHIGVEAVDVAPGNPFEDILCATLQRVNFEVTVLGSQLDDGGDHQVPGQARYVGHPYIVGFDGHEFMVCLPTQQTLLGCVIVGAAANFDVRKHCYQVRGTSEIPGVSDDPQRLAWINEWLGPSILHTVLEHFQQQVASAVESCSNDDLPPPPATVAWSVGDPHIYTFQARREDPQVVGETELASDAAGDLVVQARTAQWSNNPSVAVNVAIAARDGDDIVAWYADGTVRINHVKMAIANGRTHLSTCASLWECRSNGRVPV
jgi:hypothetical protein